jgi:hypothetical protein
MLIALTAAAFLPAVIPALVFRANLRAYRPRAWKGRSYSGRPVRHGSGAPGA